MSRANIFLMLDQDDVVLIGDFIRFKPPIKHSSNRTDDVDRHTDYEEGADTDV